MGQKITLGGERLGSGKKNQIYLHNYERSTHNLSKKWASSMGVGMLIPFYSKIATRGDKFEIDLSAGLRTIPTKGPLFGSFKLQLDMFQCPLRLYQALLHNNPLAIGLKTQQIKWPKIRLWDETRKGELMKLSPSANNSLIKYIDISGMGTLAGSVSENKQYYRDFFGAGVLAYYDIFKNYYANKQEELAYTLAEGETNTGEVFKLKYYKTLINNPGQYPKSEQTENEVSAGYIILTTEEEDDYYAYEFLFELDTKGNQYETTLNDIEKTEITLYYGQNSEPIRGTLESLKGTYIETFNFCNSDGIYYPNDKNQWTHIRVVVKNKPRSGAITLYPLYQFYIKEQNLIYTNGIILNEFQLANIDEARMDILSFHEMGQSYYIDTEAGLNYCSSAYPYVSAIDFWKKPLGGICVKTYQNDLFNNWINTEWIDGENGIAEITAVATTEGSIKIDAINFAEKLYNLLNRVAASDGTYEGYLDVAYTESDKRFCESPMWIGGMSDEIVFEEIVQTAPAEGSELGTLGGRGNLLGKHKGGKITVKVDEPSLIMGIVSITPRIMYTQGNEWHNTELDSLADIHVPALDGIAFQNLMAEQMHYGAAVVDEDGQFTRPVVGKVPAWINYMTDVDRAYGDFAATGGDGYMILNRNYDCEDGELLDATTYIDPAKYNYAFAYTKRDAQNFWVQINCNVVARRLMSAKQIPSI